MKRTPASAPALRPNVRMPPAPREGLVAVARQGWVMHPGNPRVLLEMARDGERRLAVPGHAQMQRLDALEQEEGVERRQRRAQRAHRFHPRLHGESKIAEGLVENHAVVAARGRRHLRKLAVSPVKL